MTPPPPPQDERFLVFPDIRPAADVHLQVIPKEHITNLASLRPCEEDYELGEWGLPFSLLGVAE